MTDTKRKEFEYKYKVEPEQAKKLLAKVKRIFPAHITHTISYHDLYFIKTSELDDLYVPYFLRLRTGTGGHELTTKSLLNCAPGERNEKNQAVKDPTITKNILEGMGHTMLTKLQKYCEFITTKELWITMDLVNKEQFYFEIEVSDDVDRDKAFEVLDAAEKLLGLTPEDREDKLLFEIYTTKKMMRPQ